MMPTGRTLTVLLVAALAVLTACKKKQPSVPQPQTQAPTITIPQPPAAQPPQPTQPQPQPTQPQPQPTQPTPPVTATKPKRHKKPNSTAKKTAPVPKPPEHKTVTNGGTDTTGSGQLSAGIPQGEALHQRQTTAQLRISTEKNLSSVTRTLTDDEQAMVQQTRAYIAQSRTAEAEGDTERAYNLALKAFLLSNELVKR